MEPFESAILSVLPLKESVVFPGSVTPLFVIRADGLAAVERALRADKRVFLTCQKNVEIDRPEGKDLFEVGCVAEILQVLRVPDGSLKILVEGLYAARAVEFMAHGEPMQALLVRQEVTAIGGSAPAYIRAAKTLFEAHAAMSEQVPEELLHSIGKLDDPLAVVYAIASYSSLRTPEKQQILESPSLEEKFMILNSNLEKENQVREMEDQIVSQVKSRIGQSQREFFLNEQLRIIERELGVANDENPEYADLAQEIEDAGMSREAKAKATKELKRLERMAPLSPEATIARTYIETLVEVPWQARTEDRIDLTAARQLLDEDHHGLEKVKERIIEYLAVAKLAGKTRGPILCFVGPPGVGKTSLARSIASCIDRKFVRISLGGVRDEAEIRGHRRTYIGAMPGKIIQSMRKAGTVNPVFLLDEIDKMSSDFRGDPASALLEVLDPEQNVNFNDHYLEVDYNLSEVMFITTANTTAGIPGPLLDRMEIIRISGYTDIEKTEIARRYLIPKAMQEAGLRKKNASFTRAGIELLIRGYTRESGVRSLEREISSVCRKVATRIVSSEEKRGATPKVSIEPAWIRENLGPEPYRDMQLTGRAEIGNAIGLAWTEVGGEVLHVEARKMAGKGNLILTGKLGEVMKESANTALSYIRSQAQLLEIDPEFHQKLDIHLHLPEGAIPKDGPSAGITLATALVSILSEKPVRQDVAMTGEMTLRGRVLKIGGLKEKALAALRLGIRDVLVPEDNMVEISELPEEVRRRITFHPVGTLAEVLRIALSAEKKRATKPPAKKKATPAGNRHRGGIQPQG